MEAGDLLCLMVQSAEHATALSQVHWHPETVRQRWPGFSQWSDSTRQLQFTSLGSPVAAAIPLNSAVAKYYTARSDNRDRAVRPLPAAPSNGLYHSVRAHSPAESQHAAIHLQAPHIVELPPAKGQELKTDNDSSADSSPPAPSSCRP